MIGEPLPGRSLRQAELWIFDLDNTLYPASTGLFVEVDRRMRQFIAELLRLSHEEARAEQKRLFRTHGTTLRGLMVEYGVEPIGYMDFVHNVDVSPLKPDDSLNAALRSLPGQKLVYTNGSSAHAMRVLQRLGLEDLFGEVFDIVAADWVPKPDPRPYNQLMSRLSINPLNAVMVEDMARNLVPAATLGMQTVWINNSGSSASPEDLQTRSAIHYEIGNLSEFLTAVVTDD